MPEPGELTVDASVTPGGFSVANRSTNSRTACAVGGGPGGVVSGYLHV